MCNDDQSVPEEMFFLASSSPVLDPTLPVRPCSPSLVSRVWDANSLVISGA